MTYGAVAEIVGPERRTDKKLRHETRNLRRDMVLARRHRTDWRTVQMIRWSDALHRTLLKSVAY
jgi:hypothetical protein